MKQQNNSLDLTGKRFGKLSAVEKTPFRTWGHVIWKCLCDCGRSTFISVTLLNSGHTQSCGCLRKKNAMKHGHCREYCHTRTYGTWVGMKYRCYGPKSKNYNYYGGRGIVVEDPRWLDKRHGFKNFLIDMGEKPTGLTLERIDNDKGYCKANCRWATRQEQANNIRSNRILEFNGQKKTIAQWGKALGIPCQTLIYRLNVGKPTEEVLTVGHLKLE